MKRKSVSSIVFSLPTSMRFTMFTSRAFPINLLKSSTTKINRKGDKGSPWEDKWLGDFSLCECFPYLYRFCRTRNFPINFLPRSWIDIGISTSKEIWVIGRFNSWSCYTMSISMKWSKPKDCGVWGYQVIIFANLILTGWVMMSPWLIFYPPKRSGRLVFPLKFKSFVGLGTRKINFWRNDSNKVT